MAKAKEREKTPAPKRKEPPDAIFDRALDVVGMPEREDGESVNDYVNRDSWGPNTRANLLNAEEAAERFDQVGATAAVHSARQHHDNPAPPDSKPLKP